jgi:predicted metalloprotease with PDZ domain
LSAGLDRSHSWGSAYWGGALFCLVADVRIREQSGNRKGLEDALQGIVAAGGTIDQEWPLERALAAGDRATGTTVMRDLYKEMGQARMQIDLDALWSRLGVGLRQGRVALDEHAPEAAVREAIMAASKHDGG